jgi:ketosteroid isomerase-like protein
MDSKGELDMKNNTGNFKEFMKQRAEASEAYVRGDADPLDGIAARVDPASFFSPGGGSVNGASKVRGQYKRDATMFEPGQKKGRKGPFRILHMEVDGNFAYWVGFQTGSVLMRGKKDAVATNLRVTEIFPREGKEWKLIHRHADPLAIKAKKS